MTDYIGQQWGSYRLTRLLGQGGFAEVYLGEHVYLESQAAIKLLYAKLTPDDKKNFLAEARLLANLKHPQIIRILDFGVENDIPFLVMDYAPNHSLRTQHPRGSQLTIPTVVSYVKQIASALQYAHDKKIVHRDIKPDNILLGQRNEVFLGDFGIATVSHSYNPSPSSMAGTVPYMAPEQVQGKPRSASDQYALGIVVYEWLSGDYPFHGSFSEIASQHVLAPPPPLREKVPTILSAIEEVVLKALAKQPEDRFESVQAFAEALEKASVLPNESYYPQHVALAIRTCYHEWGENSLGTPKEISPDDANACISPQGTLGYKRPFAHGSIYWSERSGAQPIWGDFSEIHEGFDSAEGKLGFPLTPELPAELSPQGTKGVFQRFEGRWNYPEDIDTNPVERCGASLYHSEQHGAHPTWGGIGICYERQGGTSGTLGFPISSELNAGPSQRDTTGKYQRFEGGSVYWSRQTEAHPVCGEIGELHNNLNGVAGRLGFPLSHELPAGASSQGTTGVFQRFEGTWDYSEEINAPPVRHFGASVYWSQKYGAHPTWGGIGEYYEHLGGTTSTLGFPTCAEMEIDAPLEGTTGWYQHFEGGDIYWSDAYGAITVTDPILEVFQAFGGLHGRFGFPKSLETSVDHNPHLVMQEFEGGVICVLKIEHP